jgi:SAM-dependent methyltransferase
MSPHSGLRNEMNSINQKTRSCAICGSNTKKPLFQQRFSTILLVQGYTVAVCGNCGFAYADDIPEQEAFDAYYRDLSKYEYEQREGKESEHDDARFREMAELLSRWIPAPHSRILDIGCSTGRLLSLLKERGFSNVWGLDPSPGCAEAARRLYGVPVLTTSLSGLAKSREKFDFVIMIGVLEHIRDLDGALATIHQILSPNGRVHLEVPDATQFADWPDAPFQQFSTEHINFFSSRSLANLMQVHGFGCGFSEKIQRAYTETTVMPCVQAVFENSQGTAGSWIRDAETEMRLLEYICQSQKVDTCLRQIIERTSAIGKPVIVWGVGTHTQRLLAAGALDRADICLFVDSNAKYHGQELRGIPIVSPESLRHRTEPILVCSRVFQREIQTQIRDGLGLNNELLLLYNV